MNERAHLLIVDDDREIRGLLAQYLEKHDFRTTAVADGKEMRRVMERSHVDLLVLEHVDRAWVPRVEALGVRAVVTDTLMRSPVHAARLAGVVLRALDARP